VRVFVVCPHRQRARAMGSTNAVESKLDYGSMIEFHVDQFDDCLVHLQDMDSKGFHYGFVSIWREAFLGGAVDHHTVIYEYGGRRKHMSLKMDWGREGLRFRDSSEDLSTMADIIERKWCRIKPGEVRDQLMEVKGLEYVLTTWNCQHFSRHFFDRACEASRDLTQLVGSRKQPAAVVEAAPLAAA